MIKTEQNSDLKDQLESFVEKVPFLKIFPFKIVRVKKGFIQTHLVNSPVLLNHFNYFQAGVYFTVSEITGGLLCSTFVNPSENLIITKSCSIDFRSGVSDEFFLEASLEESIIEKINNDLINKRKSECTVSIFTKKNDGQIVTESKIVYYLRRGIPNLFSKYPLKKEP